MTDIIKVPLEGREGEAIMWCLGQIVNEPEREPLGPTDPLQVLLDAGHARADIMRVGDASFQFAYDDWITGPLTSLQKDILRVCVENTTFLIAYRMNFPGLHGEAAKALRTLAVKLEAFDIEVSHIPDD
jgi:hypothetical protein